MDQIYKFSFILILPLTYSIHIEPNVDTIRKETGVSVVFICKGKGISRGDLDWYNNYDQVITSNYRRSTQWKDEEYMLLLSDVEETDSGDYHCRRHSTEETVSITLTVTPTVKLEAPPMQTAVLGSSYKLKCKVSIGKNIVDSIIFSKGPEILPPDSGSEFVRVPDGLLINEVSKEHSGNYTCMAFTAAGISVQKQIKLSLIEPPSFYKRWEHNIFKKKLTSFKLYCNASGTPPMQYKWTKNRKRITDSNIAIKGSVLQFNSLQINNQGIFLCEVSNIAGEDHVKILQTTLTVVESPTIDVTTNKVVLKVDESQELTCKIVQGNPKPMLMWNYTLPNENLKTVPTIAKAKGGVYVRKDPEGLKLVLSNVQKSDAGNYFCIAEGMFGETAVWQLQVEVQYTPLLKMQTMQYSSWVRGSAHLYCVFESNPRPVVRWYKPNRSIPFYTDYSRRTRIGYQKYNSTLDIAQLDEDDFGTYRCESNNSVGVMTGRISLERMYAPRSPIFQLEENHATSITLRILPQAKEDNRLPINSYKVLFRPTTTSKDLELQASRSSSLTLSSLQPDTDYIIKMAALSAAGIGNWSAQKSFRTNRQTVPNSPEIISRTEDIGSRELRLVWKQTDENQDSIIGFKLKIFKVLTRRSDLGIIDVELQKSQPDTDIRGSKRSYIVRNLSPLTTYRLSLLATNNVGDSSSTSFEFKTLDIPHSLRSPLPHIPKAVLFTVVMLSLLLCVLIVDISCYKFNGKKGVFTPCICYHVCNNPGNKNIVNETYEPGAGHHRLDSPFESNTLLSKSHGTHIV